MFEFFSALGITAVLALTIYTVVETFLVYSANRSASRQPSSGLESAVGKDAVVSRDFEKNDAGMLCGRVVLDGEDWLAEYVGTDIDAPRIGQRLSISDIDVSRLTIKVVRLKPGGRYSR